MPYEQQVAEILGHIEKCLAKIGSPLKYVRHNHDDDKLTVMVMPYEPYFRPRQYAEFVSVVERDLCEKGFVDVWVMIDTPE